MKRNQLLKWAVVLLVITNVVTIATILYHNYKESVVADSVAINTGAGVNMLNGRFFRQTLGFSEVQMDSFRDINQDFRPYAMDLTFGIDSLKTAMFTELQKAAPDTVVLSNLSEQIGQMHGKLKYGTFHFYLNVKKICSPAQSVELEKAFLPLFKTENITTPNQHRRRGRDNN
ncbi:hypothetical protein [Ferruginibacter sp.]|nr:hypothetical protein [Ferruginibacter sp.]